MKNFLYYFFIFIFFSNCTLNRVIKHHGVHFLEKKNTQLIVGTTNKNDIMQLLGPPSTVGTFDKDLWIYMEIQTSPTKITRLGKKTLINNNILILEIDKKGLLTKNTFLNKEDMKKLKFTQDTTQKSYSKDKFMYEFLYSLRQKINDPLGKKKIK